MSDNTFDYNRDGVVDQLDAEIAERLTNIQKNVDKDTNQTRLAWVAMIGICTVTILLFVPFIPDSRIIAVENILDLYYVTQASVIGMYMGVKAYLDRRNHIPPPCK